jgi:hypothetical protein
LTVQTWEIENIRNTVKYITNDSIVLTDGEADACLTYLNIKGEEIKGVCRAEYYDEDEGRTYEGLLIFSDYRIMFLSYVPTGETTIDFLQFYEYYAISNVSSMFDTSTHSKLTFEYNGHFKDSVLFSKINSSITNTLVSMINHYSSIRKAKDYKKSDHAFKRIMFSVGSLLAALFIIGVISAIFVPDEYDEEYEVTDVFEEFDEYQAPVEYDVQVENNNIIVEELLEYTIGDSYFTNIIEPPNYRKDYPTIFHKTSEDNTIYFVIETKASNLSNKTLNMIFDTPIRFTLVEDDFYEFFAGHAYLINDSSEFVFDYDLSAQEEIDMYIYFEVPKKLKDNDNKIDLKIDDYYNYEGIFINLR